MKQFLNVLYRRILYKIPLKFLLVLLALFAVCFASFSKAEILGWFASTSYNWTHTFTNQQWYFTCVIATHSYCRIDPAQPNWDNVMYWNALYCFDSTFTVSCNNSYLAYEWFTIPKNMTQSECISTYWLITQNTCNAQYSGYILPSNCPTMSSLECQTNYSLIPISSVDQNYCTSNNLCPSCEECEECSYWSWWVSELFINNINHIGSPRIYMTIPQEISWDYEYTQWWNNMLIDIEWYNVDYEYMDWVVDIQSYKPNSEDFSSLVSSVLPLFVPWLVIILFIYFLFRFIKKIF